MKSQRFSMVWRFSFGVLFRKPSIMAIGPILDVDIVVDYLTQFAELSYIMLCHCAFEANYGPVTHKIVQYMQDFSIPTPHSAHDCAAVLYLLSNSDDRDESLNQIRFENCANSKLIIKFADVLANKHEQLQIHFMKVCGGQLTDSDICHLFNKAEISFRLLAYLELNDNKLTTASFLNKSRYCSYDLFHLDLSYNPLGASGLQNLESAICAGRLVSLHQLTIQQTLTCDQDINSALLTTLCSVISRHCLHFNHLDLSHNNLGVPGAQAIGIVLHQMATQGKNFALKLNDTELHDEGVTALIHSLDYPCYLSCLLMCSNCISTGGTMQLAEGISSGRLYIGEESPYYKDLDLSDNPLCFEQTLKLLVAASHSCSIRRVKLGKCWLTKCPQNPRRFSISQISQNAYAIITCLYLDDNHFSGENVHILVYLMLLCQSLMFLSCCHCDITSKDLKHLLSLLSSKQLLAIRRWWLNDNELDDGGVLDLIEYLLLFLYSPDIDISGNPVSSEMQESFHRALDLYNGAEDRAHDKFQNGILRYSMPLTTHADSAFQTQWEVIVSYLHQLATDALYQPSENKEGTKSTNSNDEKSYEAISEEEESQREAQHKSINEQRKETPDERTQLEVFGEDSTQYTDIALAIKNLDKVQTAVWEARIKWCHLGLKLGIPVDTLDAIQYNHPTNCDQSFTDMIKEWLRASDLQRTWETLTKALESPQVGHSNLAKQIRSHCN